MEFKPSEHMAEVRRTVPLVHHITNYVTVNDCANVCICAGGSPVMSDAEEDVSDMAGIASSLVLNIGTLNRRTVDSMFSAGRKAKGNGTPVMVDPVGAGATPFRTDVSNRLIDELRPEVIKGNAGEMGVISGLGGEVKGVDSHGASGDVSDIVREVARGRRCIAAATGPVDYVSDGDVTLMLENGDRLLECVSGTGCMVSSMIGCYIAANGPSVWSVASAISAFNVAAEDAARAAKGPGTFKQALLDAVYNLDSDTLDSKVRWVEI